MYRRRHDPSAFLAAAGPAIEAIVADTQGSAPREAGAWMLVAATDVFGTVGGGALELAAIEAARRMLETGLDRQIVETPLGPEIGQCCGGRVALVLQRLDAAGAEATTRARRAALDALRPVFVFGAGHVGRALAEALALAPVRATLIDSRAEALAEPIDGVASLLSAAPEAAARYAPAGAAFVVTTHDHALDFLIVYEALARGDAAYVGMIGSKTKRARCESWARAAAAEAGAELALDRLTCPIGAVGPRPRADVAKRPEAIAAAVVAELLARLYP